VTGSSRRPSFLSLDSTKTDAEEERSLEGKEREGGDGLVRLSFLLLSSAMEVREEEKVTGSRGRPLYYFSLLGGRGGEESIDLFPLLKQREGGRKA